MASIKELNESINTLERQLSEIRANVEKARDERSPLHKSHLLIKVQEELIKAARDLPFKPHFH